MDGRILVLIAVAVLAGAWFWWNRGRSGDPESHLRRICFGDQSQAERLIDGEIRRSGGAISRAEAARRAVQRHRRDNR